ncbi:MAG: DUF1800 family protein [Bacteroidota bacterium]
MKRLLTFFFTLLLVYELPAQFRHYDYLGGGHQNEVAVTVSSASGSATGLMTIDGFPIQNQNQLADASRFLAQATLGADYATIQMTAAMGYDAWMEEQFALPPIAMLNEMFRMETIYKPILEEGEEAEEIGPNIGVNWFHAGWIDQHLKSPDLLRQKMAFSLSQIFVVNDASDLAEDFGQGLAGFYDLLSRNAFGDYQNLLTDVTLSPAMGFFLSHYDNPKADPVNNIQPDENYAREIMQLFSIGLWELNQDGSRKLDANGLFIPTYSNQDINEFAQVFTGLSNGGPNGGWGSEPITDDRRTNFVAPMRMYEEYHDRTEKVLLKGTTLPSNQDGMTDILQTMAHLSTHSNTAPFISKALIQFFTTSNPSQLYIFEVAGQFRPTEQNNFQEVLKAILLNPEARVCTPTATYTFGKLREPVARKLNLLKAFPLSADEYENYFMQEFCYGEITGQLTGKAPSVFNFFVPSYAPPGDISTNGWVAPEFQILNSTNAIGLVNDVNRRVVSRIPFALDCNEEYVSEITEDPEFTEFYPYRQDFTEELTLTNSPAALVDRLDILLANGLLEDDTKTIMVNAISQLSSPTDRLRMAIYLIMISPDYAILK